MDKCVIKSTERKMKRARRVRQHLRGCCERPRLCVVKSNAHVAVQLIDDENGVTIGSLSTYSKEFRGGEYGRKNKKSARVLGERIAALAKEKQIESVIFDRGPFKYHGVIAAVAEGARESGLKI